MKIKLLGTLAIVLGVFVFSAVAAASDADVLQPASTITYNESLDVNGTIYANSAYIGEPGIGGVTFFNGTIVNNSDDPVTFGDDVRIDGEIWRSEKGGDNPLKISDHIIPTLTNINNFGDSLHRWNEVWTKDVQVSGKLLMENPSKGVTLTIDNKGNINAGLADILWVPGAKIIGDELEIGKNTGGGGLTVSNEGKLSLDGDIVQHWARYGAVKAMAMVDGKGTPSIIRSAGPNDITITRSGLAGSYQVNFGFNVSGKFISVVVDGTTMSDSDTLATYSFNNASNTNSVQVYTHDTGAGNLQDRNFIILVY